MSANDAAASALHKLERGAIAAASHITYRPSELLMLIRDHLQACGLAATAESLEREASAQAASAAGFRPPQTEPQGKLPDACENTRLLVVLLLFFTSYGSAYEVVCSWWTLVAQIAECRETCMRKVRSVSNWGDS